MEFKDYTTKAELFFEMLPKDWQESILPFWENFKASTQLYVVIENDEIVAGGLVFSKCPPDMLYFEKKANNWFKKGFLYLGFIYVDDTKRNRNLGSIWLDKIKNTYPNKGFWLAIEDENLHRFYSRNQFEKVETIKKEDSTEESIYIFNP